jgi:co-chaperonin GroES (HSP10)
MPLIPMRDRLVLREIPHDTTPGGLTIIRQEDSQRNVNMAQKMARSAIRCVVVAQGVGMLIGETGEKFENSLPGKKHTGEVYQRNLVGCTVVVSHFAGFEDEDPITGEKHLIVTPLDILAVVEGN